MASNSCSQKQCKCGKCKQLEKLRKTEEQLAEMLKLIRDEVNQVEVEWLQLLNIARKEQDGDILNEVDSRINNCVVNNSLLETAANVNSKKIDLSMNIAGNKRNGSEEEYDTSDDENS